MSQERILVTGAGGFIGHHLVKRLKRDGFWVRGVDIKSPEYETSDANEFDLLDLRRWSNCLLATRGIDQVYNLAADMGGIGYITAAHAGISHNNTLINTHMLEAARTHGVTRFLFSSSACVYAQNKQKQANVTPLKEEDAYPADPEPGYGWENCGQNNSASTIARTTDWTRASCGSTTNTVPWGLMREARRRHRRRFRARSLSLNPAKRSRCGATANRRARSCTSTTASKGLMRLMASNYVDPLNLGTEELISIDGLVDLVSKIADKKLIKRHDLSKPQGVRGRNSDNSRLRQVLGWEPSISLSRAWRLLTTGFRAN